MLDERARRYFVGMATHWTLGCDAADPHGIAAFWAIALGYVAEPGYDNSDGAELVTAGATTVREESYGDHLGHVVMLDPEGNEFCVA
jgi:hypothetical protein